MKASTRILVPVGILILNLLESSVPTTLAQPIPEDAKLNFTEFGRKFGYRVEELDVNTEDGYILKLFHIPGNKTRPVLLMHGIASTADSFIIRGRNSLALSLAQAGYDVWAGNTRGSTYSQKHSRLTKADREFWDFSFHEIGYYDLPATIDFILATNNERQLFAIGHSQGNSLFYVLGATRPEYNDKIKAAIALGPIAFLSHLEPPVSDLVSAVPVLNNVLIVLRLEEILGEHSLIRDILEQVCYRRDIGYVICARNVIFTLAGADADELEPEFFPIVIGHFPKSVSRKNVLHLAQVSAKKSFSQFDYGLTEKNLEMYNSETPPIYDLSRVSMKLYLFAGKNDKLSSLKDVKTLSEMLPNSEYVLLERKQFNHFDHVWGRNMKKYLFPLIFDILEKYY